MSTAPTPVPAEPTPAPAPRRHPLLKAVGALLLLLAAATAAGGAWLLGSDSGLRWAWARLGDLLDQRLTATAVSGSLAGPLTLEGVRLASRGGDHLHIRRLRLDWTPSALLQGTLAVAALEVEGTELRLAPDERAPRRPFTGIRLPLRVRIDAAVASDLTVIGAAGTPRRFEQIQLAGQWTGSRLELHRAAARGPWGTLAASGSSAGLLPDSPLDLTLEWSARHPRLAQPLLGSGPLRGTVGHPRTSQSVTGPLAGRVDAELAWRQRPMAWSAQATLDHLDPAALDPSWRPLAVTGTLRGGGTFDHFLADAALRLTDPALGGADANASLEHEDGRWRLPELALRLERGGELHGSATFDPAAAEPGPLAAELSWSGLRWPLDGEPAVASESGHLRLRGAAADYRAEGDLALIATRIPPVQARFAARGDSTALSIEEFAADWLDGRWQGQGRLGWAEGVSWELRVAADAVNPATWAARWPGRLAATLTGSGRLADGRPRWQAEVAELRGELHGQPLSGDARLRVEGADYHLEALHLDSGGARVEAAGRLGERWDLAWSVAAGELGRLLPQAAGSLDAKGQLRGPRATPRITAEAAGKALGWGDYKVGRLTLKADVDLATEAPWQGRLEASELAGLAGGPLDRLTLTADGTTKAHRLELSASAAHTRASLSARGGYAAAQWRGALQGGRVETRAFGDWSQEGEAPLRAGAGTLALSDWCWRVRAPAPGKRGAPPPPGGACLTLTGKPGGRLRAEATVDAVPLALLPGLPAEPGLVVAGRVGGSGSMELGRQGSERLALDLRVDGGHLTYPLPEAPVDLTFERLTLTAAGDRDGTRVESVADLAGHGHAEARVRLAHWLPGRPLAAAQPLDGSAELRLDRLDWLTLLSPELAAAGGSLSGALTLGGSVGEPRLGGDLRLTDGHVDLPGAGIGVQDIHLTLASRAPGELVLNGGAGAGAGELALAGTLRAPQLRAWRLDLALSGRRFETVRLPAVHLFTSPNLALRITPGVIDLGGEITVPEATIKLRDLRDGGVRPSPDVVVVGAEQPPPRRWKKQVNVTVVLGEAVAVEGFGFSGRLQGRVALSESGSGIATATGELDIIGGLYEAYGQQLAIDAGRLLYAGGPVDNPGLDLRAERRVDDVTAGMRVSGTLQNPRVELYSEPALEDSDVLAYLLLGRPLSAATQAQGGLLYHAALSLGLKGGDSIAKSIGARLGLDEVTLAKQRPGYGLGASAVPSGTAANRGDETSLILGKQLSPRLYLRYIVGLGEALDAVQLRYKLTERLTLEAESGLHGGADLMYIHER